MIEQLLLQHYGLTADTIEKSAIGAGSDTYFVTCQNGRYVMKFPATSSMNNPEAEPEVCEFLLGAGIPVCQFIRNKSGAFLSCDKDGRRFHLQRFIEGKTHALNEAPDWLLTQQAETLEKIYTTLRDYKGLTEGIGEGFFRHMTPENASRSYAETLKIAVEKGDMRQAEDLKYRIALMKRFPKYRFNLSKLTLCPTHGDFFLSQIICGDGRINAVIDWTTACVHPVVWEITRSYVYAVPECARGEISTARFIKYVREYMRFAPLTSEDIRCLATLFYYQISVCDYYRQYYSSTADNRHIYLQQAEFSTALMKWFEINMDALNATIAKQLTWGS